MQSLMDGNDKSPVAMYPKAMYPQVMVQMITCKKFLDNYNGKDQAPTSKHGQFSPNVMT